jgi:hypothetical protein
MPSPGTGRQQPELKVIFTPIIFRKAKPTRCCVPNMEMINGPPRRPIALTPNAT